MPTWDEMKDAVEKNGNVLTVTMEELRNTHGVGRLGKKVIAHIHNGLAGVGLGHVPQELPGDQHEPVRLYKMGTPIADAIITVLTPSKQNDAKIKDQFGDGGTEDYGAIVQKIRELVRE
jgi:hypothetical protein